MSAIVILFLIFDAVIKLIPIAPVIDSMAELGYPGHHRHRQEHSA